MTVGEFCRCAISDGKADVVAIQKRTDSGDLKTIRYFWESTPDDVCPELDQEIARQEIEDNVYMFPIINVPHIIIKQ